MATNFQFEYPVLDWDAQDTYQEFIRFRQHVEFVFKGPLAKAADKDRAGWIGMWIGRQGREVYKTLTWQEAEEDNPTAILDKLADYVRPRKNKRVARYKVRQRKQKEGESFDNFVKDLKLILMDCEYNDPDDILVDAIIDGVQHPRVQEKLLDQGQNLTLTKALEIGRQFEMSQQQMKVMCGEETDKTYSVREHQKIQEKRRRKPRKPPANPPNPKKCKRCGLDTAKAHTDGKCPAQGTKCTFCKKANHWYSVCRKRHTRRVNTLQEENTDSEPSGDGVFYIRTTQEIEQVSQIDLHTNDKWLQDLRVGTETVTFRIDTGAKCSLLVKSQYNKLKKLAKLEDSCKILKSYSNHAIKSEGSVTLPVKHTSMTLPIVFEVVNLQQENIICGDAAEKLGLIHRVSASTAEDDPLRQLDDFPELVKTTGTLPGKYTIKLDPKAKGVVHPPRKQPVSLKPKIIEKLIEMEQNEYITRVHRPTEWVSSMVASLRKDKIRICIDPSDLNRAILREHHPMKTLEEVVAEIPHAKVFSVLDAKSGFLQIKLDEASSFLTTFNTPIGRYQWLRLPFGIKSAPEIYQRIMDRMLEGIEGATAIMDDILVVGESVQQHDKILKQVIKKATEYNLKLNFEKCQIRQTHIPYIGHILTGDGLKPDPSKVQAIREMPEPTDKAGVKRFLGLVQYLAKFIPNLSQVDAPLRMLLKSDAEFTWSHEQRRSFEELKHLCSTPPVLTISLLRSIATHLRMA